MTINQQVVLRCDRCGRSETINKECYDAVAAVREAGHGWRHISSDIDLCGECAESYARLKEKHDREVSEFLG